MIMRGIWSLLLILSFIRLSGNIPVEQPDFGMDENLGALLPRGIHMLNEDSVPVLLNELITKPTLLVFVYYNCTDQCPKMLGGVAELANFADVSPGIDYGIITISIDHRESAALAGKIKQKYLQQLRKPVDQYFWRFFTADSMDIAVLTDATGWKFRHSGTAFIHPTVSILVTPNKMVSQYFYGTYFNYMHFDFSVKQAALELTEPTRLKNMQYCSNQIVFRSGTLRLIILIAGITLITGIIILFLYLTLSDKSLKIQESNKI